LDRFCERPIQLKWPNDLYRDGRKLAGILVEARWRDGRPDWVAVGIGINIRPPEGVAGAASLGEVSRTAVLFAIVPALRAAARERGLLTPFELEAFAARDLAHGRIAREPAAGRVAGITPSGDLLLDTARGLMPFRTGSLVLEDSAT
jgi:BirA family biotin operon repressor/biotin-[acetyl-CoA-carboxylase] ligase